MIGRALLAALVALGAGAGCSERPMMPEISRLEPDRADVGQSMHVAVIGRQFFAAVRASYDDEQRSRAETTFSLWLGDTPLGAVTFMSASELRAVVPATLAEGRYRLRLRDPRGREATLDDAFTVGSAAAADGRADVADAAPEVGADLGPDAGRDATADAADASQDTDADTNADAGLDGQADVGADADASADTTVPDSSVDTTSDMTVDGGPPKPVVQLVRSDPFGDGTPFLFVFEHGGDLYVGPRKDGHGAVRSKADGANATKVDFALPADTTGNTSANLATPPFPSVGAGGCQANTLACGPDNEDGRGLFTSGTITGKRWLLLGGGHSSGTLGYIYMSDAVNGATLPFNYVDLHALFGNTVHTISASHILSDRVYLGFASSGAQRPYLLMLKSTPAAPGLDARDPTDAEDLRAYDMPGIGSAGTVAMIDAITDFGGRLYLANGGGCMRATTPQPGNYRDAPQDWSNCTPGAAAWGLYGASMTTKHTDLEPRDKAIPQMAAYRGQLYMARNTSAGPQLWVCAPNGSGTPGRCDPGDWSLVAADAQSSCRFGNASNTHITLLVATATALYVGYDNANDGIVIFRSTAAAPATRADFEGQSGCSATLPACQGIGGNGFGTTSNARINQGVALRFTGKDYIYVSTGDGSGAASIHRIVP
ncbi:MAG: hypothetical protein KC503_34375 [Myxococcales bacterium]|nr:hypothetical protein [Myxococcales bacterium]